MTRGLYSDIVDIVSNYLGPAAPRFVDRQIKFHLDKDPQDVAPEDLGRLSEWISVSMALLTDDQTLVDECAKKLIELA